MCVNGIDILITLFLVLAIFRGFEAGLVRQAFSLIGLVCGIVIGSYVASAIDTSLLTSAIIIIFAAVAAMVVSEYLAIRIKNILHEKKLNVADKYLGSVVGIITCLMLVWFSSVLITAVPSTSVKEAVRNSHIIAALDRHLPPATNIMNQLEQTLAKTQIPDILRQLEPDLPDRSVELPNLGQYNNAVKTVRTSVVEIEGRSCQGIGVGSGFVAGNNLVVTNAHVVAGMLHPYVQDANGRHNAKIVGFDDDMDIAVLQVHGLAGKPLALSSQTAKVGTGGAILGYPGGGPLTAKPSVVIQHFTAISSDVYNEGTARRDVYALKSDVQPGNSGGPLIDDKGVVYGVIFARSTNYNNVGYAVSSPSVRSIINKAVLTPNAGQSARCAPVAS